METRLLLLSRPALVVGFITSVRTVCVAITIVGLTETPTAVQAGKRSFCGCKIVGYRYQIQDIYLPVLSTFQDVYLDSCLTFRTVISTVVGFITSIRTFCVTITIPGLIDTPTAVPTAKPTCGCEIVIESCILRTFSSVHLYGRYISSIIGNRLFYFLPRHKKKHNRKVK